MLLCYENQKTNQITECGNRETKLVLTIYAAWFMFIRSSSVRCGK